MSSIPHFYTADDLSIDILPSETAMELCPVWLLPPLKSLWNENKAIVLAGGFVAYTLGYTTDYGKCLLSLRERVIFNPPPLAKIDIFTNANTFKAFAEKLQPYTDIQLEM